MNEKKKGFRSKTVPPCIFYKHYNACYYMEECAYISSMKNSCLSCLILFAKLRIYSFRNFGQNNYFYLAWQF